MEALMKAYNRDLKSLDEFYSFLNKEIEYEPGKSTSLGIIYWGRTEHMPDLKKACDRIASNGTKDFCALHEAVRTPSKMRKFAILNKLNEKILKILSHDLNMWMPQRTELSAIPLLRENKEDLKKFCDYGIEDQISFLSGYFKKTKRKDLAKDLKIKLDQMNEYIKICDFFRMGGKLEAIRPVIFYKMGYDTHQKWAKAKPAMVIKRFDEYMKKNKMTGKYLTPFTKEIVNTIEWAKVHHGLFKVEY
ncbi:hypothetical protein JXL83_10190 [candidate division WOR-3 bacterium]|nr:hypothetical protein [candidate division WOR-3 bacterium]